MGGSSDDERYPRVDHGWNAPLEETQIELTEVPLGLVLLRNMWTATKGSLSLDLKRPTVPRQVAARKSLLSFRRRQEEEAARSGPPTRPGQFVAAPRPARERYAGDALPVVPFSDTGARLKVMRHVQLGPVFEGVKGTGEVKEYPALDFGLGLNFELDTAELKPQARLKLYDILSLRALPRPGLKLSKRLPVPGTDWGVRLSFDCPIENLDRFWQPPASLLVSIDNLGPGGLRLTQWGVEFSGQVSFADGALAIRGAGHLDFPQQLPVAEGEPLVRYELRRLGLKATW